MYKRQVGIVGLKAVGALGTEALAAVGTGQRIFFVIQSLIMAVSTGTTALMPELMAQAIKMKVL